MSLEFTVTVELPAEASSIYNAWLDSRIHAEMTAADSAVQSKVVGADHKADGDYIWGKNLELIENQKIVQSWRASEFKEEDEDSIVEVVLEESNGATTLTLTHRNLPDSDEHYKQGWIDYYFEPMKAYFSSAG